MPTRKKKIAPFPKTKIVRITRDREKLWKCSVMRKKYPQLIASKPLPSTAGERLEVILPAATHREIGELGGLVCGAKLYYHVAVIPANSKLGNDGPRWVCGHQIDE